jgi:hypothetical protein
MKSALSMAGVVLLASVFMSIVAQAQKTSAGYDKNADFSNFKTFAFDTHGARNPFVNKMIIDAVERELTSRGLTKVEANSDLLVVYMAATGFDLQIASVPFYTMANPAYTGVYGDSASMTWDVTTGTLVIDLHDNKAERIVFRGTAKDVLQRAPSADAAADAKSVAKPINKGISKIFKKYPIAPK